MLKRALALSLLLSNALFQPALVAQRGLVVDRIHTLPAKEKRWALLIGVNDYDSRDINPLHGAANDAQAMKKVLTEAAGFAEDKVVVLATGQVRDLRPIRANIITQLSRILQQIPKDGLLLVQFSGHGVDRGRRPFLLAQDSQLTNDLDDLEQTSISVDWLQKRLQAAGIAQVVILLDACRNDPSAGKDPDTKNALTQGYVDGFRFDLRNKGVQAFATLYATTVGDRAWENNASDRGYFLSAVEEAMRGKAANPRTGEVTLASLVRYVKQRVPQQVARDKGNDKRQVPFPVIEGYADDLVLAVVPGTIVAPSVPSAPDAASIWDSVKASRSCAAVQAFYSEYGTGPYGPAARIRMAELCQPTTSSQPGSTGPKQGDVKINPKDGQRYVWLQPGRFHMGCSAGDTECWDDEKPARDVTITRGFWMAETPITVEAWKKVYGKVPSWSSKWTVAGKERDYNPGWEDGSQPLIGMTWDEANGFCKVGGGRLPTEAEYEYAGRAGSTAPRYGDLDAIAWYGDNSGKERVDTTKLIPTDGKWEGYQAKLRDNGNGPHSVGTKLPNAWGLFDMLGNVWSWTADWYGQDYYKGTEVRDPKGPNSGTERVLRGGSWFNLPRFLRASVRFGYGPALRDADVGARCVGE